MTSKTRGVHVERDNYLKVLLEFDGTIFLTATQFKLVVVEAVQQLFGEYGRATIKVDVLHFRPDSCEAILKVPSSDSSKLQNALTLFGKHCGVDCRFRVLQESSCLIGLTENSRNLQHQFVSE